MARDMVYVTQVAPRVFRQMTLDELLFEDHPRPTVINENFANTRTDAYPFVPMGLRRSAETSAMKTMLSGFIASTDPLRSRPRNSLYSTFYRGKKDKGMKMFLKEMFSSQKTYVKCNSGKVSSAVAASLNRLIAEHPNAEDTALREEVFGDIRATLGENGFDVSLFPIPETFKKAFRRIDAPCPELKRALDGLKKMLEEREFNAMYHTSAFAYVHGRSVVDALRRHQQNESRWFGKLDFSDFFGSTTPEFVMSMLKRIYPFAILMEDGIGAELLREALDLAFLDGHLPQGTPVSPLITNLMMIPVDHILSNTLRDWEKQKFVYTRYADDILISSRYSFDIKKVTEYVKKVLDRFGAPFTVNESKTRYGSRAGSNWNLGLMLNKDNEITVGWRKKREFQSMLHSYVLDRRNGKRWDLGQVYALEGMRSYYRMVEGETIDRIVAHVGSKLGADIPAMIKEDIKTLV